MPDLQVKKIPPSTKKCPYCYTYVPLNASECTACKKKLGRVDKLGFATKPVDWKAYFLTLLAAAAFALFLWWAFFRE